MKKNTPFGDRLIRAFNGAPKTTIAKKLKVSPSSLTDYTTKDMFPPKDVLVGIAEITKCNLHWLLTGEGEPGGSDLDFLTEAQQAAVGRLAEIEKQDVEGVLRALVMEGLRGRASYLFSLPQRELELHELKELEVLAELLRKIASEPGTSPAKKKTAKGR